LKYQLKAFSEKHPTFVDNTPIMGRESLEHQKNRAPSEMADLGDLYAKNKTVLIVSFVFKGVFVLLFGWLFTVANSNALKKP
jgi:hypothetical protein